MAISNDGVESPSSLHMASQKVAYFAIFTGKTVIYALFASILQARPAASAEQSASPPSPLGRITLP